MSAVPKNLRAFADMLSAVQTAIEALDKFESLEQFEAENQRRVSDLKALAAAAQAEVERAKADAVQIKADADATLERAAATAKSVLAKADADANNTRRLAAEDLNAARSQMAGVYAEADAASARLVQAQQELADLRPMIDAARATIAKAAAIMKAMS